MYLENIYIYRYDIYLQPHAPTLATSVSTSTETSPDDKQ